MVVASNNDHHIGINHVVVDRWLNSVAEFVAVGGALAGQHTAASTCWCVEIENMPQTMLYPVESYPPRCGRCCALSQLVRGTNRQLLKQNPQKRCTPL